MTSKQKAAIDKIQTVHHKLGIYRSIMLDAAIGGDLSDPNDDGGTRSIVISGYVAAEIIYLRKLLENALENLEG